MSFGSRHEGTPGVMIDWKLAGGFSARKKLLQEYPGSVR